MATLPNPAGLDFEMPIMSASPRLHGKHQYFVEWVRLFSPKVPPWERDLIASSYLSIGNWVGIPAIIAFAQGTKECDWFTSPRWLTSYNPVGLGATNDGAWGSTFGDPTSGIVAHYAHLLAYAVPYWQMTVKQRHIIDFDPRWNALKGTGQQGKCPRWIDLNGRWAKPGDDYGQTIIARASVLMSKLGL